MRLNAHLRSPRADGDFRPQNTSLLAIARCSVVCREAGDGSSGWCYLSILNCGRLLVVESSHRAVSQERQPLMRSFWLLGGIILLAIGTIACEAPPGSTVDSDLAAGEPVEENAVVNEYTTEGFGLRFDLDTPTIEWATNVSGYLRMETRITNLTSAPARFQVQADILCPERKQQPSNARGIPERFFPDSSFGPLVEIDPGGTVEILIGPIPFVNLPATLSSCQLSENAPRYLVLVGTPFDKEPGPDGLLVEDWIVDQSYPGLALPFDFVTIQSAVPDLPADAIDPLRLCANVPDDRIADLAMGERTAEVHIVPGWLSCSIGRASFVVSAAPTDKDEWRNRILGGAESDEGVEIVEGVNQAFVRDGEAIIERGDSIILITRATPALDDGVLEEIIRLLATAADQQLPTA